VTVAGGGTIRIVGSAGALEVPSNFTNHGTVTVASGGTIRVVGSAGAGELVPMSFVNLGFVDLEAGALFSLADAVFDNPASGNLRGSGVLELAQAAAIDFDGTLSPGLSPGIFTVDGSMAVGSNTNLAIEVGGESAGAGHDRLDVTGVLGAAGVLDVALLAPYHPAGGERFEVLTYDHLDGWFQQVSLPPLMHLLDWSVIAGEHEVALEVVCLGTELGVEFNADRDPVSLGYEVIYRARISNGSPVAATDVVVSSSIPPELVFRQDLSSPECMLIGSTVECTTAALGPGGIWDLDIGAVPVSTGLVAATGSIDAWECDLHPANDQATAVIEAVAAAPCDANYDLAVNSDDLQPTVGHILGENADGNPDCRLTGGITADDIAAIIVAAHR
jgi:uncharacterized repeat protein (TIGR01451 family)